MMSCVNLARNPQAPSGTAAVGVGSVAARDAGSGPPASPAARRLTRPTWRDPRLLVGVVIVAACVLLGAELLAGADDTVPVWSAREDLTAGRTLQPGDLERSELRFTSDALAQRYLSAAEAPSPGLVLLRDVAAGELVPRSAVGTGAADDVAELPIALASDAVPAGLRPGERVDVWVTPPAESGEDRRAVRILEQVPVLAAPKSTTALGPASTRQVVVGVPGEDDSLLARALAQLADGTVVLVRRG